MEQIFLLCLLPSTELEVYLCTPPEKTDTLLECDLSKIYANADHNKQYHNIKWQFFVTQKKENTPKHKIKKEENSEDTGC